MDSEASRKKVHLLIHVPAKDGKVCIGELFLALFDSQTS